MKTLILVFHPTLDESKVNSRWIEELNKYPDELVLHGVYRHYPDGAIELTIAEPETYSGTQQCVDISK